jgi:hypothetical protein
MNEILPWKCQSVIDYKSSLIELSGTIVSGTTQDQSLVVVNYTVIPGNDPVKYGNWAGFWRDNGGNFWEGEPIAYAQAANKTSRQILIPLNNLIYGIYYVGYYCDEKDQKQHGAPCATLSFPGVEIGKNPFSCSVIPTDYENGKLKLNYATPSGNNPKKNSNLVALFEGSRPQWDCSWKQKLPIASEQSSGQLDWQINLNQGATYTLAYMNGTGCQNIAACCTFTLPS